MKNFADETIEELELKVKEQTEKIDSLLEQLEVRDADIKSKNKEINTLLAKIQELQDICFDYSDAVYEHLGVFADDVTLTPFQILSLNKLKATIDKNLAANKSGEDYRTYLTDKYINKDGEGHAELVARANEKIKRVAEAADAVNNAFIEEGLSETSCEDDTETLIIKE